MNASPLGGSAPASLFASLTRALSPSRAPAIEGLARPSRSPLSPLSALPSRASRALLASLVVLAAAPLAACTTLATSPEWVGGGLAVSAPVREAAEDARVQREAAIAASQPTKVEAKHILVMHANSRQKPEDVVRTREEARARAQEALLKIRGGADFDAIVTEYTDEPGGAKRLGALGAFDRTQMVKPFSDAAFSLRVGEVSELVETPYGFHIIKRTK